MSDVTRRVYPHKGGHCPRCATALTTGQGVYSCPSCEWIGVVEESARKGLVLVDCNISQGDDTDGSNGHPTDHHTPPLL